MEQILTKRRYFDIGLQIEELLYSGVFKAGERLPAERELSERFQTSRTTIREAIIMLELKGVVEVKQGAGTYFIDSLEKSIKSALALLRHWPLWCYRPGRSSKVTSPVLPLRKSDLMNLSSLNVLLSSRKSRLAATATNLKNWIASSTISSRNPRKIVY